ncbi:MAG: DUF2924 domain-containing protein [Alphaproteobacteria bacterium]
MTRQTTRQGQRESTSLPLTRTARDKTVEEALDRLPDLDLAGLRQEWTRLYGKAPSRYISRDLLMRAVAYRIQENAYGGLKPAVVRQLRKVMEDLRAGRAPDTTVRPQMQAGVRLMRDWNGETHTVEVLEKGFAWRGKTYSSLSAIAQLITGVRWSGPRFFGLHDKPKQKPSCKAKPAP